VIRRSVLRLFAEMAICRTVLIIAKSHRTYMTVLRIAENHLTGYLQECLGIGNVWDCIVCTVYIKSLFLQDCIMMHEHVQNWKQ